MPRRLTPLGITTLEDISALILQSHDLDETLSNIVALVAKRMRTEVCSIYLLDDEETLRLRATKGLSKRAVGRVTMKINEGLTGLAIEERRIISIEDPEKHPRYRYFKETREERFHSFVGVPLFDRNQPIGVMAIQTKLRREFSPEEISTLATIAFQVSSVVTNARLLDAINRQATENQRAMTHPDSLLPSSGPGQEVHPAAVNVFRGTVAYPGLASGAAHLLDNDIGFADVLMETGVDPESELQRLEAALEKTRIQTIYLEKRVAEKLSEDDAAIFHTHLMIMEDRTFLERIKQEINNHHSAPYALKKIVGEYIGIFERMDDPYLRERAADMEDIGRRLLANLLGQEKLSLTLLTPGVLIAKTILPSDMAALDHEKVLGIVTETGEKNSHAVIMAKSLGIPALVGVKGVCNQISPGIPVILDANSGCLYIDPNDDIVEEYQRIQIESDREQTRLDEFLDQAGVTADGTVITLRANIGLISDIGVALRNGADGVGLYRTEFPYMTSGDFPDRDNQYLLYRKVIEGFNGAPVTIRTLDIGGDKALPYFKPPREDNPFMGWRSVRVSLDNRDIFRTQVEAILMAAMHGPVKLLFPMISGIEEIRSCREVVAEACQALTAEGILATDSVPIGIMIEVPAAIQLADDFAHEVDFFALGTNDLVQYMLAADRNNPLVNRYYDPLHPGVLRALHHVIRVARKQNKGLCLCGEMASDPLSLTVLVGMGIREFSMAAPFVPRTKAFLHQLDIKTAEEATTAVLRMTERRAIRDHLTRVTKKITDTLPHICFAAPQTNSANEPK